MLPDALDLNRSWDYPVSRHMYAFAYLIAACIGLVLVGMTSWHVYLVSEGRTQLEWMDEEEEGFPFHLGRMDNFRSFFNVKQKYVFRITL